MKIKKIVAAIAAAAMAVTMTAVNAFALSIGEYPGDWGATSVIPKAEFAAIGGDVKVTLDVEHKAPLVGDINALLKPMNICVSWDQLTWTGLTSDTAYAKGDGFIVVPKDCTTIEFVVPESVWSTFVDYEGGESEQAGMAFQVCHVNIKNVTLSAGAPQGEFKQVSEEESAELMKNGAPAAEAAPEASTEAPATGNAPVAAIAVVMALAGAAAVASKKN
ncbi:MAG: hypothetical protein IKK42_05135 [Oscillospiraceae bacterium]|nr:hypothetical protein [Oscillospiraceae bacterium]